MMMTSGSAARMASMVTMTECAPGSARTSTPPARRTIPGIQ
jgi:hypothetical protein